VRHSRALQKKDFRKKGISEYCETWNKGSLQDGDGLSDDEAEDDL
jgi:hypothetical protein